jgi:hypothetical protein
VRELRSRIPSKVADTSGSIIHRVGQLFGSHPFNIPHPFPVCPILAEQAVKRTPMVKHSKVFKPIFWI